MAETAHEFLADERTPKRLAHLLVHSVDDESFRRILGRMVLNFLRDGGRRTEIGRLMLRLRDVLGRTDEFVAEAGDRWRLEKQPASAVDGDAGDADRGGGDGAAGRRPRWSAADTGVGRRRPTPPAWSGCAGGCWRRRRGRWPSTSSPRPSPPARA